QSERSVLRWGGLAGMLSALLLIAFGIVGAFIGTDPAAAEGLVTRFPDIRGVRIVENGLYLAVIALWFIHLTALDHALRGSRLAPALFGRALATPGLVVLAAGALPHIATTPISDLYHAPGATAEQQAALVMLWQATEGMFDALLVTGLLVLPVGLIAYGLAMRATPAFGARIGWLSVGLGLIAFATAVISLIEVSDIAAIGVFALIAFHLVVGWKTHRLSTQPARALEPAMDIEGMGAVEGAAAHL
ncbi:MAG: hypothetical protein M3253_00065, partial [Chloroflexota bacterium]|nr:hypothetical protein [Chloroflexota bacterium]